MDVNEVRARLTGKLGAVEDRRGHHVFFYLEYDGREYRGPKMSHSWRGNLNGQQVDWLKKPLLLSKSEFEDLVDCSLTMDAFFNAWVERKGLR